jgi:hypothetical protein
MATRHILSVTADGNNTKCKDNLGLPEGNNSTDNTTTPTEHDRPPYDVAFVVGYIIEPLICISGVVGNSFALAVFKRQRRSSSAHFLLRALAVCDLLFLVNVFIFSFLHKLLYAGYLEPTRHIQNFEKVLWVSGFLLFSLEFGTIYMIVIITIDR